MSKKISIIVIFHNQESFVEGCLSSIISQSYPDIEIICIDDASSDGTFSLLCKFEREHHNLHVLRLEQNMSENIARKRGVELATGDYILFVDGDDYLDFDACTVLMNEMQKDPVEILHFGTYVHYEEEVSPEKKEDLKRHLKCITTRLTGEDVFRKCFITEEYSHTMWGKLFAVDLMKRAFGMIEEFSLFYGGDKYEYFVASHQAQSYRGIGTKLYHYNYGTGISKEDVTLAEFEVLCSITRTIDAAERYIEKFSEPYLKEALAIFQYRGIEHCLFTWKEGLSDSKAEGLKHLLKNFDPAFIVTEAANMFHTMEEQYKLAKEIRQIHFPGNNSASKDVKVIAAYYNRLRSGGTERVMSDLSRFWTNAGYKVILLTDEAPSTEDYSITENVERIVLPSTTQNILDLRNGRAFYLEEVLKTYKVDILVYHGWISRNLLWDLLVCKWNQVRFVIHCHNIFSEMAILDPPLFRNLPFIYTLADGIVTLSKTDQEFWSIFHDTVFHTVNPMRFCTIEDIPRSKLDGKTVIWCQRFSWEKNPEDMLTIFRMVYEREPAARLWILGKGEDISDEEKLRTLVDEYSLSEVVTFFGYRKNVEDYYKRADVCMVTSTFEGFPLGLMESLGAGVPVVMYELPYLTIVEKGKGIISVKDHDKQKMAEEIVSLLRDKKRRVRLGEEGRASVGELLSFDFEGEWKSFFERVQGREHIPKEVPLMWETLLQHISLGWELQQKKIWEQSGQRSWEDFGRREWELNERNRQLKEEVLFERRIKEELNETVNEMNRSIEDYEQDKRNLRNEVEMVRNSKSFRLGRAITFLPRLIRELFRSLKKQSNE